LRGYLAALSLFPVVFSCRQVAGILCEEGATMPEVSDNCAHCGVSIDGETFYEVRREESTETVHVCESCEDRHGVWRSGAMLYDCQNCGLTVLGDVQYINDCDAICSICIQGSAFWCGHCDTYHFDTDGCDCDCNDHHVEDSSSRRIIHDYGYRPEFRFYDEGEISSKARPGVAYLGLELELEFPNGDERGGAVAVHDHDPDEARLWLTHDGSLEDGFEVTSQPMTLKAWRAWGDPFAAVLGTLSESGGRAWSRRSAGIHVHLSRSAFANSAHLARFLLLFSTNEPAVVAFAGRRSSFASFEGLREERRYRWTDGGQWVKGGAVVAKAAKGERRCSSNHSDAINLSNSETIEVRVFRSSLAVGRVFANLELIDAALNYTRGLTYQQVTTGALEWSRFRSWVEGWGGYPYLVHCLSGNSFQVGTMSGTFNQIGEL